MDEKLTPEEKELVKKGFDIATMHQQRFMFSILKDLSSKGKPLSNIVSTLLMSSFVFSWETLVREMIEAEFPSEPERSMIEFGIKLNVKSYLFNWLQHDCRFSRTQDSESNLSTDSPLGSLSEEDVFNQLNNILRASKENIETD